MIITIVAAPDGSSRLGVSQTLPTGGASIGRSSNSTLTLPDTSRITSSNHATITEQLGAFTLVDHSSNGTFLNGAETPVEKGFAVPLNKGDIIGIGPYQLAVDFEDAASVEDNLGGSYLDSLTSNGGNAADAEPVAPIEPVTPPVEPPVSDSALEDDLDRWLDPASRGASEQAHWGSPQHAPDPDSASIAPTPNIAESIDPLEMLNNATPLSSPPENPMFAPLPNEDSQWWQEPQVGSQDNSQADPQAADPQADNAPAIQHAMPPPVPVEQGVAQPAKLESKEPPSPIAATVNSPTDAVGANMICQRMGLRDLSAEQLAQLPPVVADALVQTLSRLMEILRARSTIKNEIRATHTVIGAMENNPLKFAAQIDDALNYMFSSNSAAFMPTVRAIDDSFNDLEDHQMATLAGTRAAYDGMLCHFNPTQLIEETGADPIEGRLTGGKKAKAWDAFQKHYNRLLSDPDGTYNRLFGDAFALSYEEQVRQLKAMRRQ